MYKNENPLSEQERAFAEEKHDEVVFKFLCQKALDVDDYYGVVIPGYLYAVRVYLSRPELREQYSFQSVAYKKMQSAVYKLWRYESRPKRSAKVLSLDSYPDDIFNLAISDRTQEHLEAQERWKQVRAHITIKEMEALLLKSQGYSYREIADAVGLKNSSSVSSRIWRMRQRIHCGLLVERMQSALQGFK